VTLRYVGGQIDTGTQGADTESQIVEAGACLLMEHHGHGVGHVADSTEMNDAEVVAPVQKRERSKDSKGAEVHSSRRPIAQGLANWGCTSRPLPVILGRELADLGVPTSATMTL
jgi:hypothetical protein